MKTSITLSAVIINLLVLYNLWIIASTCSATHNDNSSDHSVMRKRYESWLKQHGRKYNSRVEQEVSFEIYQANVKFIESYNSQNYSYKLTDNKFADLTNEEFEHMHLGYRPRLHLQTGFMFDKHGDLPKNIDWRKRGAVTHVKDQGNCGKFLAINNTHITNTCTDAHSNSRKLLGILCSSSCRRHQQNKNRKLVSLSEQELLGCDNVNGNEGCDGGNMEKAFTFIKKHGGLATDKNYPSLGSKGTCNKVKARNRVVTISGYQKVPAHNERMLTAAVAHQPISVGTDAGGYAFQLYSKGIFSGSCGKDLNHGMTIVGYGEENGEKYWLVKNSWANDWGESGYVRMKRDSKDKDGTCGIAMEASYPVKH